MKNPAIPEVINKRYRVIRLLGRGGMGQVLLVEDTRRDMRRMALKTLLPKTTDHLLTTGFRQEFAELAKLEHRNLAKAYDFGRISGKSEYFFTTEFVPGSELMAATADATVSELTNVSAQIFRALDFIHDHGILHNDLKPANILVAESDEEDSDSAEKSSLDRLESLAYDYKGRVKVIDFGLISREHTAWKHVLGTARYISPERIRRKKADRRSDLYSMGVVLYLLFARRPPFEAQSAKTLLRMHLDIPPAPLRAYRPDLPDPIIDLVHKLLEKSPDDRFRTAGEALDFLSESGAAADRTVSIPTSEWKDGRITAGALLHREQEVKRLREAFDAVRMGEPDTHGIVVQGPSGIGKSRLVDELRGDVQVSGGAFVAVGETELGGNLKPLADALIASLQTSGVSGLDKVQQLFASAAEQGGGLEQALEKVILWFTKSNPLLFHVDGLDRASKPVRQFTIELLHAADSRRGEETCRLLLVISRRSPQGRADLGVTRIPIIELGPFGNEESATFLRQVFGQDDIPEAVLWKLVEISEGNPLFLLELANQLLEESLVIFTGARWRFPEALDGIVLPASLDSVFEEKISSLNDRLLDIVKWIAASGHPIDKRVLKACTRLSSDRLNAQLETLVQKNVVVARTREDGVQDLQLTHWRSRKIVLDRLGDENRRHLHQRIAQNISAVFPNWEEQCDTLAEHWLLSGNEAGFLRFAPRAAEILRDRGDLETAVFYHQRIAESVPETSLARKLQSLAKLSEMREFLWDLDACYDDLAKLLELGRKLMRPRDRVLLLRRMGAVELARHRPQAAMELFRDARALIDDAEPLLRLSVDAPHSTALWLDQSADAALENLNHCLEKLETLPHPGDDRETMLLVGAANHLAALCHLVGRLETAEELFRRNFEILGGIDQPQALGATRCALGSVLLDRGSYANAENELQAALEIGKKTGDRRTLSRARERLGEQYVLSGRFREALQITQVSLQDAERMKNPGAIASSLRTLGRIHSYADEAGKAGEALQRAHRISAESGDTVNLTLGRLELAGLLLLEDRVAHGLQHLKACRVEAAPYELPLIEGLLAKWAFVSAWKAERIRDERALERASALFRRHGYHGETVALALLECEAAIELGDIPTARNALTRLESLTDGYERPDIHSEADYLLACIEGNIHPKQAAAICRRARSGAREQHKMRLVRRLTELEERFAGLLVRNPG